MKLMSLTILNAQFRGVKYIHSGAQPSPLSISRNLPSSQAETVAITH